MGRGLYSPAHDNSNKPQSSGRAKVKPRAAAVNPLFAPGQSIKPTEDQRIALRQRQASERAERTGALRDKDLMADDRREYEVDGEVTHSEPRHRSPHPYGGNPGDRKIITLSSDPDTELSEEEKALMIQQQSFLPARYAFAGTPALQRVISQIAQVNMSIGSLRSALAALKPEAQGSQAATHHVDEMILIVSEAMQPWLREVDEHAAGIIEDTQNEPPQEEEGSHPPVEI